MKYRTILLVGFILVFSGGGSENHETDSDIVEFVWTYAESHPDGFTINIISKTPIENGLVVSYSETQNSHSKECLTKIISHALAHDFIVGGWLNTADSLYYFDSNKVFPETAIGQATRFAIDNGQKAIYNFKGDSTIWINKLE